MAEEDAAVPRNTPEQLATIKAADEAWAKERTLPLWEVGLLGDDAVWVARPGRNVAEADTTVELELNGAPAVLGTDRVTGKPFHKLPVLAGDPMPWIAPATASVQVRAATPDQAKARALAHNAEYHTITGCTQIGDGLPPEEA